MHLPSDHENYNRKVYLRSIDKIKYTSSWRGISTISLDSWIGNFKGEEERFLAHRILDHLIYRSEDHVYTLLQSLFYQVIPSILLNKGMTSKDSRDLVFGLADRQSKLKLALCYKDSDSTSSAVEVGRRIKAKFRVHEKNILRLQEVSGLDSDSIVFVLDDFSGTGSQASKLMRKYFENGTRAEIYFTPLIGHSSARIELDQSLLNPGLIKGYGFVEEFNSKYNIFSSESKCFRWGGQSYWEEYKNLYDRIFKKSMKKINPKYKYGRAEQGLIFSFHYRCPNNCIPLIWYDKSGWSPLITR